MTISKVLRAMFPGADEYTDEQIESARKAVSAIMHRSERRMRLPSVFVPIGGIYKRGDVSYRCVARPRVNPRDCCRGCAFYHMQCPEVLQCSKFDREDGRFVWFVKEEGE